MSDERINLLISTIKKLSSRGAKTNIQKIFVKTHTADIALILEAFSGKQQLELFEMEPSLENRAEILSHFDSETQKKLLSALDHEMVSKLVGLMESDDAADLLGELSEEESSKILSQMDLEDSDEVADLLSYPEDSAGGLMGTNFLPLGEDLTVEQAIQAIQVEEDDVPILFYIYIINENENLLGVLSLKQLLLSRKTEILKDIMSSDVISVPLDMSQTEVARIVERYDFLSIPVVNGNNHLEGVITVDDVIDVIREEAEEDLLAMGQAGLEVSASVLEHFKARAPWIVFSYFGGILSLALVSYIKADIGANESWLGLWGVIGFLPLVLSVGATVGNQTSTIIVSAIIGSKLNRGQFKTYFLKELILAFIVSTLVSFMTLGLGYWASSDIQLTISISLVLFLQVMLSSVLGGVIPFGMNPLGKEAALNIIPVFNMVAEITALILVIVCFMYIL
ncbi:MAG: magnesium transporter [Bdellovibrionaceae bacterium]|jgi:magnesium transporter|nr:magnesium transporter [Pseudobdellovibrionaceae bacterium]